MTSKLKRKDRPSGRSLLYPHSFIGVDGEGWTDANGVHHYITFTVGDKTLYTGKPLTMKQVLQFLSSQPTEKNLYYVSYYFDYDVTMILRELAQESPDEARLLFNMRKYLWYKHYGLTYLPKKKFIVKKWSDDNSTKAVIVHDVQGFFQMSFINALEKYQIGTIKQRKLIANMKAQRGNFDFSMAKEIIKYSELECHLLAKLVNKLRGYAENVSINPSPYEGPGPMAARALDLYYGKKEYEEHKARVPDVVMKLAERAYYGGRFEIAAHGPIPKTVYQYDINSAYPAAMLKLPCLDHGTWKRGIHSDLFLAKISWQYRGQKHFGASMPFPVRTKEGSIYFPESGTGWYWSKEILPAEHAGFQITYHYAYSYINHCDCQPFKWVNQIYLERKKLDKKLKGSGIPLKLVLNTLYGKMVQSRPAIGKWNNMVWGSLITSITRARVYKQSLNGSRIIMYATDAIFSLDKIDKKYIGGKLGQYTLENKYNDLCIFQPGIYFSGGQAKFKTRGIPKSVFREYANDLYNISLSWNKTLDVQLQNHLSLRLGLHFGHDWINNIGNWLTIKKRLSASPELKRIPKKRKIDNVIFTAPYKGGQTTVPYSIAVRSKQDKEKMIDDFFLESIYEGDL